jgi:antitoxin component YwqK of YwqJK toxin-antitoxin module
MKYLYLLFSLLAWTASAEKVLLTEDWQLAQSEADASYYAEAPAPDAQQPWPVKLFYISNQQVYFSGTLNGTDLINSPIIGDFVYYHSNGNPMTKGHSNAQGQYHGEVISYWPDGNMRGQYQYHDGELAGEQLTFHENGKLHRREQHKNGKPFGIAESYHSNGTLASRRHYDEHGEQGLYESFYDNGQPEQRTMIKNGEREGERLYWSEDGSPVYQQHYLAGKLHGEERSYRYGGVLYSVKQYQHGIQVGKQLTYDEAGKVVTEQHFDEKGREVQSVSFNSAGNKSSQTDIRYPEQGNISTEQHYNEQGQLIYKNEIDNGRNWRLLQRFDDNAELIGREERLNGEYTGLYLGSDWQGNQTRAHYCDGEFHGDYLEQTPDGSEFNRGKYHKGKKVGKWVQQTQFSTLTEQYNNQGEPDGEQTEIDNEGVVLLQAFYRNGKLDGDYIKRDVSGRLQAKGRYVDGEKHGNWQQRDLYSYGTPLLWQGRYQQGKMVGLWQAVSDAGHLLASTKYDDNGLKQGKSYRFNEDGSLISIEEFKDDVAADLPRYYYNGVSSEDDTGFSKRKHRLYL